MKKHFWQLVVGNIGTVLETKDGFHALNEFRWWRGRSKLDYGSASGEFVVLFKDGEIHSEHFPSQPE